MLFEARRRPPLREHKTEMTVFWMKVSISFCVCTLAAIFVEEVRGLTVHDRILINANIFFRPARRLWIHKVYPRHYFANSWWGKCHFDDAPSLTDLIDALGKMPKFDALDVSVCGRVAAVPRVFNGTKADRQVFKYNAALMETSGDAMNVICGSSILSSRFVLTAAHCLQPFVQRTDKLRVSIGEYDLAVKDDQYRKIMRIAASQMHKDYTGRSPFHNDIAIIRTSNEITFNDFIGPICLPPVAQRSEFFQEQALVSGWGRTTGSLTSVSPILLRTWVPVVDPETCWYELNRNESFFDGHLCAGGDDSSDSCQGDSGGPLVIIDHRQLRLVQIGIVSFSFIPVCGVGKPAVYVNLQQYTPWILETVGLLGGLTAK